MKCEEEGRAYTNISQCTKKDGSIALNKVGNITGILEREPSSSVWYARCNSPAVRVIPRSIFGSREFVFSAAAGSAAWIYWDLYFFDPSSGDLGGILVFKEGITRCPFG